MTLPEKGAILKNLFLDVWVFKGENGCLKNLQSHFLSVPQSKKRLNFLALTNFREYKCDAGGPNATCGLLISESDYAMKKALITTRFVSLLW